MASDVTTVIGVPGLESKDRTIMRADVVIRMGDGGAGKATVTITPTFFERAGRRADPPAAQTSRVTFDTTGTIIKLQGVTTAKAKDAGANEALPLAGSAEDLGAMFGSTIRRGRVRIADRWRTAIGSVGERRSRVAALRWVGGRRCAIVESIATRPVERTREAGGTVLRLAGTETSVVTTAFDFTAGFPASIDATADGTFTVAGAPQQGTISIRSKTTMTLTGVRQETPSGQSPGPTPSPTTPTATATATATLPDSPRPTRPSA